MGLTIAKQLIELMGGSNGFVSREGEGSEFWVEIEFGKVQISSESEPVVPAFAAMASGRLVRDQAEALGLNVLVAEDNSVNLTILESVLQTLDCRYVSAANGMEAIESCRKEAFDLILMDLQMPIIDGIEATKQIRQDEVGVGRHTPIIALTAHALQGDRERCIAAGMDDYLSKPIRRTELIAKLKQWGKSVSFKA